MACADIVFFSHHGFFYAQNDDMALPKMTEKSCRKIRVNPCISMANFSSVGWLCTGTGDCGMKYDWWRHGVIPVVGAVFLESSVPTE
jgi:hypothetical protein